jgi:hypothetical protein
MEIGGKPFPLTVLKGGINRLRIKGGASPSTLYDLLNGFIDITGAVQMRPGTDRNATLDDTTAGLCFFEDSFNVFSNALPSVPAGYTGNVLVNPEASSAVAISFASPGIVTWPDHGLAIGTPVIFEVSSGGTLPAPLVAGTAYYISSIDYTDDSFALDASLGGAIDTTNVGSGTFNATAYTDDAVAIIWFAQPFMGFLYVVAQFESGVVAHFWLQSSGPWAPDTVYQADQIVTPLAAPNGFAYQATRVSQVNPTWAPEISTADGAQVEPVVPNGYYYVASDVIGVTPHTGETEPTWPAYIGGVVQEYGDYATTVTPAVSSGAAAPLATSITDRYGDSSDISGAVGTALGSVTALPETLGALKTWAAGVITPNGAIVVPTTTQGAVTNAIPNGDFEDGDDGSWVFSGSGESWSISNAGNAFQGSYQAICPPGATAKIATMSTMSAVTAGTSVEATLMLTTGSSSFAKANVCIGLNWYEADGETLISQSKSPFQGSVGGWSKIDVIGVAPAGAAFVNVFFQASSGTVDRDTIGVDLVQWNLETPSTTTQFIYEAIQAGAGVTGSTQPVWPTVEGNTVIDGTVTWQAVGSSIITWTAFPIEQSGAGEPTWPTVPGQAVADGNMAWTAITRQITDPNCPHTIGVTLGASHVFAVDKDIVAYSAAVNPTDWTSPNNAGYLPTGLNVYGANPMAVLGLYRGNLIAMNSGGYQMWQIDPDPSNMALLDAQPIGSTYTRSFQAIASDSLFAAILGIRSIGTTGATANMQTGQTGQQIDPLVQPQIAASEYVPISLYYPARGQYWLIFGPQAFVLTVNGNNQKSWSRYVFPDAITDWTLAGEVLYLRSAGNLVWEFDPATLIDDAGGANVEWTGIIRWPYLDLANFGFNKMLDGFDLVGTGEVTINFYYDETNVATCTPDYTIAAADTLPGQPIAMPLNAPSYSMSLTFAGNQVWSWQATNIYAAPLGSTG